MMWLFIRKHSVRIVIGAVLVLAIYCAISVHATYQQEKRIAQKVLDVGGEVGFQYSGPTWLAQFPVMGRLHSVKMNGPGRITESVLSGKALEPLNVPPDLLVDLRMLTKLRDLSLDKTQFSDAELKSLERLTSLRRLKLTNTQNTAEDRAMLRKALPYCIISPAP